MIEVELRDIVSNSDNSRESAPRLQGLGYGLVEPASDKPSLFALALGTPEDKRRYCDLVEQYEESLVPLAQSIEGQGQLSNCRVRPTAGGKYALTFGCRRALAVLYLHAKGGRAAKVWATVGGGDDQAALIESAAENANRLPPSPIDQARLFRRLRGAGMSVKQIAKVYPMGKATEQNIRHRLRLLECPAEVQLKVHHGKMTKDAALKLLANEDGGGREPERADEQPEGRHRDDIGEGTPEAEEEEDMPPPIGKATDFRDLVQQFLDRLKGFDLTRMESDDPDGLAEVVKEALRLLRRVKVRGVAGEPSSD